MNDSSLEKTEKGSQVWGGQNQMYGENADALRKRPASEGTPESFRTR